jgi:hypothetical protein
MRRALVLAVVAVLALAGCAGTEDEPSGSTTAESTSATPTPSPEESSAPASPTPSESADDAVEIEIEGDRIEPNGKLVEATAGEPLTLRIESDRAAELHVHSSPEQVIEVEKGESTVELTVETPGVVDVEEHDTGIVILQLEVR